MNFHLYAMIGAYLAMMNSKLGDIKYNENEWLAFKEEHNKNYTTSQEESIRGSIFAYNKHQVDKFNGELSEDAGFELDLNHLADISGIEINMRNGYRSTNDAKLTSDENVNSPQAEKFLNDIFEDNSIEVPDEVDWRKVPGRVTKVKNQGSCGSCWAFASTGALEGQEKMRGLNVSAGIVELSEQNLVDCVTANAGCYGGHMKNAFESIKTKGGINSENSYPYQAERKECRFRKDKVVLSDNGAALLPMGDEYKLKEIVAKFGPVAVAIDARSIWFQFYRRGVYYNKHCYNKANQLNRSVLVVGYGTDPKQGDYWIVKNSWGKKYGENGYIRMARNRGNHCGIATQATIPTFY